MKIFVIFLSILFIAACSSPEPNPEMKDYIYLDIQNKIGEVDKSIAAAKVSIHDEEKNLLSLDIQSVQRGPIKTKISGIRGQIRRLEQEIQFLKVRQIERKRFVRQEGLKKFYDSESKDLIDFKEEQSDYSKINQIKSRPQNFSQKRRISESQQKSAPKKSESH
ncbi:MAG TPA: hypothetical protein PLJ21_08755 [Pseudobdellovibrionaceae bacterium]|nr:hypothetical protein [Pseudobdellovibrionaceae bacterium]